MDGVDSEFDCNKDFDLKDNFFLATKGAMFKSSVATSACLQRAFLKALFRPRGPVTSPSNATLTGKWLCKPILPVTVSVKKIKGAARQRKVVTVGVDEPLLVREPIY